MYDTYDINAVKKGETAAFHDFFKYFYPKLMGLACRFVDEHIAEDIVQEVFTNYWEQKETIEILNIQSYLYKCIQNNCLNNIKHQLVSKEYESKVRIAEARINYLNQITDDNEIVNLLINKDLREVIENSMEKLPPKCQEAFRLCYFHDLSYKEVAKVMNISHRTVEVHVQKAIAFLKNDLSTLILLCYISGHLN